MAGVKLNHIYKVYPNGTKAVSDFTMDIADKEFIVFVGPSGCGKSTTLRMIAGLENITTGELSIDGAVVNDLEPKDRDIAMVFQNYALYPHMTVYDNMAFGLKLRKMPKEEIDRRVNETAEILGITEYLKRKPKEMSGGQRQRVALGRAIVREPKVFLLDEPLSNLDAKLRTQMRSEILKLHRKLQTTFIYVTHDQVEAITMGTRIVVMKDGFVQQIDTPKNLYNYPCNKFVAGFIGTPQMNFFVGTLKKEDKNVRMVIKNTGVDIVAPEKYFTKANPAYLNGDREIIIGIRSEHISPNPEAFPFKATCKVSHFEDLGTECQVYADFDLQANNIGESPTRVVMKAPADSVYENGEILNVSVDLSHVHLFDAETEKSIAPRIPSLVAVHAKAEKNTLSLLGTAIELPPAMAADDGEYTVTVPPEAVKVTASAVKDSIAAQFDGEERVNNSRLIRLVSGDTTLYSLIGAEDQIAFQDNRSVYFNIDLKLLSLYRGGEKILCSLPSENILKGTLAKRSVTEQKINEKGKKIRLKGIEIDIKIAEYAITCPDELGLKLLGSGAGKKLFDTQMEFRFTPYGAKIADSGISAKVEKILDYGEEKFATCRIGDSVVTVVAADSVNADDNVFIQINPEQLAVYDAAREIKLV